MSKPLTAARSFRGLSQANLAERIGRCQSWISLVEAGTLKLDRSMAIRIGDALKVDYTAVFPEFSGSPERPLVLTRTRK